MWNLWKIRNWPPLYNPVWIQNILHLALIVNYIYIYENKVVIVTHYTLFKNSDCVYLVYTLEILNYVPIILPSHLLWGIIKEITSYATCCHSCLKNILYKHMARVHSNDIYIYICTVLNSGTKCHLVFRTQRDISLPCPSPSGIWSPWKNTKFLHL